MTPTARHSSALRRTILIICVTFWLAAFVATHVPMSTVPGVHVGDKTLHLVGYFLLTGAFLLAMITHGKLRPRRIVLAVAIMALYGAFDELTQPIVNRSAEWSDFLADLGGAALAVIVIEAVLWLKAKRSTVAD